MAEGFESADDKTEEASPERRQEFRDRGQVVASREISAVLVLAAATIFFSNFAPKLFTDLKNILRHFLETAPLRGRGSLDITTLSAQAMYELLKMIVPPFIVTTVVAAAATFLQTQFNWSWKKVAPDFSRLNPLTGITRLFNFQAAGELLKSVAKLAAVGLIGWLFLKSMVKGAPNLMSMSIPHVWAYLGDSVAMLFWSVAGLLVFVAAADFIMSFISLEKQMRMTKQEVKEEYKQREVDQQVKQRMRRAQRDLATRKTVEAVKTATVVITNPTHYAIALRYTLGMPAPVVVAKGIDHLALQMRIAAKDANVEIVENKPLARTLYKLVEVGQEIPEELFKAVSDILKYVFKIKGVKIPHRRQSKVRAS
jgi:flagellar biosynthetic protein FlhB